MIRKNRRKNKLPSHEKVDEITIKTAKLELLIKDFLEGIRKKSDWLSWLGIFLSLLTTYILTDFKTIGGISKEIIEQAYGFATLLSLLMVLKCILAYIKVRKKGSVDYIMDTILAESVTPYEFRLLYILKRGKDEHARILVFWDELYGCYMLPHYHNETTYSEKKARKKLAEYLGISADMVSVEYYDSRLDKFSRKYSEYHKRETIYYFTFCYVWIHNAPDKLKQESFMVDNRQFKWLSCQALDQDEGTRKKNSDVIRHISDNSSEFLYNKDSF